MTVEGESPLEAALTAGLTADKARRAIGALGGTPYVLGEFGFAVDEGAFLGVGGSEGAAPPGRGRARRAAAGGAAAGAARRRPASPMACPARCAARRARGDPLRPATHFAPAARSLWARREGPPSSCACGPARSSWAPRTSTPSVSICAPATISRSSRRLARPSGAPGSRCACARPRCSSTPTATGRRRSPPSSGRSCTRVTSPRSTGPAPSTSSIPCRACTPARPPCSAPTAW